jgi:hypothetical protein
LTGKECQAGKGVMVSVGENLGKGFEFHEMGEW